MQCARQCRHKTDEEVVARRPLRGPLLTSLSTPPLSLNRLQSGTKKKKKSGEPSRPARATALTPPPRRTQQ